MTDPLLLSGDSARNLDGLGKSGMVLSTLVPANSANLSILTAFESVSGAGLEKVLDSRTSSEAAIVRGSFFRFYDSPLAKPEPAEISSLFEGLFGKPNSKWYASGLKLSKLCANTFRHSLETELTVASIIPRFKHAGGHLSVLICATKQIPINPSDIGVTGVSYLRYFGLHARALSFDEDTDRMSADPVIMPNVRWIQPPA